MVRVVHFYKTTLKGTTRSREPKKGTTPSGEPIRYNFKLKRFNNSLFIHLTLTILYYSILLKFVKRVNKGKKKTPSKRGKFPTGKPPDGKLSQRTRRGSSSMMMRKRTAKMENHFYIFFLKDLKEFFKEKENRPKVCENFTQRL